VALDLGLFSEKLVRYCKQYQANAADISLSTGIGVGRIELLMEGKATPSGDEVLIFADFFKCDFKFFISNEQLAPFEQTEELFRRHGSELSREDRWSIQEFLFLCECQEFLLKKSSSPFKFQKTGTFHKQHGIDAANSLRAFFAYPNHALPINVFDDFRKIGIHIFRRKLGQSNISGIYIRHPVAGHCVLINYEEDVYRQRFTVAHEAAHAILDDDAVIVSKKDALANKAGGKWTAEQLSEIRANNFAATYLAPDVFLKSIPNPAIWNKGKIIEYSKLMHINPETFAIGLYNANLISDSDRKSFSEIKISQSEKNDSELPDSLSLKEKERKIISLQKGLSDNYVTLCFDAYRGGIITQGRLSEVLLCDNPIELLEICNIYRQRIDYGN
jgi:Zn-dependent peptidase ImmA (M78 family)